MATCGVLTLLPAKLEKNGMRVDTSTNLRLKNKLRVYTASDEGSGEERKICVKLNVVQNSFVIDFAINTFLD